MARISLLKAACGLIMTAGLLHLFPYAGAEIRRMHIHHEIQHLSMKTDRKEWQEPAGCRQLKAILHYDSLNMNEEIVQGMDDEYYLHHLCDGTESEKGTLFFSAYHEEDDMNTVLYGHHVFYERSRMTPLFDLLDGMVSEEERIFTIEEADQISIWRMIAAAEADYSDPDQYSYTEREYTGAELAEYNRHLQADCISCFFEEVREGDRILTMMTCRDAEGPRRILFIARESGRKRKDIPEDI